MISTDQPKYRLWKAKDELGLLQAAAAIMEKDMQDQVIKPTVMFVDDEPNILKAIKRVVDRESYRSLFAERGTQAIEILKQTEIQVMVCDLQMPGMDGLTLLDQVQQTNPEIIRMVLSGVTDTDLILEAVHKGKIYRYISKPFDNRELVQIVRQALDVWLVRNEKRRLQEQLAEHNRRLEKLVHDRTAQVLAMGRQAELGRYAAQIVHNLKTPLQAVIGRISLARMSLAGEDRSFEALEKNLDYMDAAATKLADIISGILQHAVNDTHFKDEWTCLNEIIQKELQFFDINHSFKYEVEKRIQLDADLPPVWINPLNLQQIIDNLIDNAIDAMAGCDTKVLTVTTAVENHWVRMTISDTGIGIDPRDMASIFLPDYSTKSPDKGTGLGLASVKTMVESYGGRVEVGANQPGGVTFTVWLPQASPGTTAAGPSA